MRKDKIQVKICVGTACFVQGGADLLLYGEFVAPEIIDQCEIEGISCLGTCKAGGELPPFVSIDGVIHGGVTQDKFAKLLAEAVRNA
ncbi:MAG: (2Fe-2S) ferredoxin domain-containing protein [Spirochaetales bacterium]|mgnify:CR=1 FL=1|jgi:NADH:ubiquinone oxidoreductase subunit E|nr:(2Fe-2S) ferredoxin domain-containing protein [Spirochaetales bacterium]